MLRLNGIWGRYSGQTLDAKARRRQHTLPLVEERRKSSALEYIAPTQTR